MSNLTNSSMSFNFVAVESVTTSADAIPYSERKAGVQDNWHVCNKCKYPVTFSWRSLEDANILAEQDIAGVSFLRYESSIFGDAGVRIVTCRDCYTQAGYQRMSKGNFKKMSDVWTKKQNRGF